jgi:hypothetical protein
MVHETGSAAPVCTYVAILRVTFGGRQTANAIIVHNPYTS